MEYAAIDFEFFDAQEVHPTLVACSIIENGISNNYNLLEQKDKDKLFDDLTLLQFRKVILVAYAVIAEARCIQALGINPLEFQWIDLYVEFRMLCNSNHRYEYGKYIDKDGEVQFSTPPDPNAEESEEEVEEDSSQTPKNLINCAYKLLGVRLDAAEKDEMRNVILSKDLTLISSRMHEILLYCESDTKYLIPILNCIYKLLEKEGLTNFEKDVLARGRYAAATALTESLGIPINTELLNKVIVKTPELLKIHADAVNEHFPYFVPETQKPPKRFKNGKLFHYKPEPAHKDSQAYQDYVKKLNIPAFPLTKTGKYKADKATLEEWGYWGGLEALWHYGKMASSLKWFDKENKNGFFERMGSDNFVRPYYGIFGTQTGRNAAKAKTFPLAMSSWLRAIITPFEGNIIGCDFSQQEVYVAAVLSGDENLYEAYLSGDVYLAFGKQAGIIPPEATKKSHKDLRNLCKSTVLGLQYGMGAVKLQVKLKLDSKKEVSMEQTVELIQAHKRTYKKYWDWVKRITYQYQDGIPLITNDGWVMFCDNPVITSVRNFPVQANSASITRLAVVRCWERGLKVMCSLHDAVYVLGSQEDAPFIEQIMKECTAEILKESRTMIRIDTKFISKDEVWVEEKGEEAWNKIKEVL